MKRHYPVLFAFVTLLLATLLPVGTARADLSEPMILVASSTLDGSPFERTVVLAAPFRDGGHIGFIVNKPTGVKLETLFPDDAAAQDVEDGAYLGGPAMLSILFAVTARAPEKTETALPLMPGLYAVVDKDEIDRILRTAPNDARYFLGVTVWKPGQLESQVGEKLWDVQPADADLVLRPTSSGLWNSLRGTWVKLSVPRAVAG